MCVQFFNVLLEKCVYHRSVKGFLQNARFAMKFFLFFSHKGGEEEMLFDTVEEEKKVGISRPLPRERGRS